MIAKRYVFDPISETVVPVGTVRTQIGASARYAEALSEYRGAHDERAGQQLRNAALERANRREFAHKRLGSEQRWQET